jgi:hypothetical protein
MKYLIVFFTMIFTTSYSQDIEEILKNRQFVLEASRITDNKGIATAGSKKLCFIMVDTTSIVVQWTADCDNNGLGGITMQGTIQKYEVSKNHIKKDTQHKLHLTCEMDRGRVRSDIIIEMYSKSHAEAILNNATSSFFIPEEMNFRGIIVPLGDSKIVIGAL